MNKFSVALLALIATAVQAQIPGTGPCPQVTVVPVFDVAAYLGDWYQISRFTNSFEKGNCSLARYGPVMEGGLVKVHNEETVDGELSIQDGTAELTNKNSTEAKLTVIFDIEGSGPRAAPYWVLGTDYTNYTVVFSCVNVGNLLNFQTAWVLGRSKPLSEESIATVNKIIEDNGINGDLFTVHESSECTTIPKP